MIHHMSGYFTAEKQESLIFMAIALVALGISAWLIYKAVEMLLLIVGVGMIAFWQRHDLAAGIGVGLVLQAAVTLTLDIFAEARGADYLSALQAIPA
jgi:hypothetical protein